MKFLVIYGAGRARTLEDISIYNHCNGTFSFKCLSYA